MFDNPFCTKCSRHLGLHNHKTSEHDYALAVMPADEEVSSLLVDDDTARTAASWCGGQTVVEIDPFDSTKTFEGVNVPTKRGVQRASSGDYIIQQDDGSFEVMGPADYQRSRSA